MLKAQGVNVRVMRACGGGSKSLLWRKMMADLFGCDVRTMEQEEGPAYGGAILAMVSTGQFPSVQAACDSLVSVADTVEPDLALTALYEVRYRQFQRIYPACKALFPQIQ